MRLSCHSWKSCALGLWDYWDTAAAAAEAEAAKAEKRPQKKSASASTRRSAARKRPSEAAAALSAEASFTTTASAADSLLLLIRELATAFRAPPQRCRSLLKLCSSLCSAFCIHKAYILVWFKTSGSSTTAKERILCCWNSLPNTVKLSEFSYLRKCKWTFLNCKKKCQIASSHKYREFDNRRPVAISLKKVIIKFWFRKFWTGVLEYL